VTKNEKSPDVNEVAARIVRQSTATNDAMPADLEAAWAAWSAGVGKVDGRTMALLRAAFEAGAEAARVVVQGARP
jgi:hypothetical protein